MKEKYPELTEKCKSCMGCNKQEDITFKGYYRCESYMRGVGKNDNRNTDEATKFKPIHK